MASRIRVAALTGLAAVAAFFLFMPKNQSSEHNASKPSSLLFDLRAGSAKNESSGITHEALEHAKQQIANAMQDPSKVRLMECIGVNPWEVKPAGWTPPTKEECAALEQKLGAAADARKAAVAPDSPPEDSAQQANAGTQATPQGQTTLDVNKTQTLKGRCESAVACDSISLIYPAKYKGGVVIVFSQENRGVFGFAGKPYFDPVEGDTKVMVEAVYSPGGVAHIFSPMGRSPRCRSPQGGKPIKERASSFRIMVL